MLEVSTTNTHRVHTGCTELGVSSRASSLILSLLLEISLSATSGASLVSTVSGNAYITKASLHCPNSCIVIFLTHI